MTAAPSTFWLDSDGLHGYLLGRPVGRARNRRRAGQRYAALLAEAEKALSRKSGLRGQVFLEAHPERLALDARR